MAKGAPFSKPRTKSGGVYSAELTNCGEVGWWSDSNGYLYTKTQPEADSLWPSMPGFFVTVLDEILAGAVADGFTASVKSIRAPAHFLVWKAG